jgi:glycosyltransferase involved in cell wall biosynthesis
MKLLSISTDRKIFEAGSAVRERMLAYARPLEELHIIVFSTDKKPTGVGSNKTDGIQLAPNCWAYSTGSFSKFFYPWSAIRLGRAIFKARGITDITVQDASLTAVVGTYLKNRFKVPLEIQVHEDIGAPLYPFNVTNKIRKAMALSYLPKADSIRVVSERIKAYLVGVLGIPEPKITVRPIIVDSEKIKRAPIISAADLHKKYPQFDEIILSAGRLEPEKGFELALKAFALVIARAPKTGLVIVGAGSQEAKLKALSIKLGLNGKAVFEGWADRDALTSYYKTTDLFLNTSLFEGYGMALVEAQAAGSRIVSTDVGVAREVGAHIVEHDAEAVGHAIIEELSRNGQGIAK